VIPTIDPQCFEAAAIANGDERAASRFGYCMASAIVDELRNGQG
jgi:hypothetical protein